jgi:hypothetical protein
VSDTPPMMPAFRTGSEAAASASKSGKSFDKIDFFSLKNGDVAILRFLTDFKKRDDGQGGGFLTMNMHTFVPTRPKPDDFPGTNWPGKMSAVCRNDPAFTPPALPARMFPDCYICDNVKDEKGEPNFPGARQFAYAVVREEVIENGQRQGYKTKLKEVKRKNEAGVEVPQMVPEIVIVNMAWKNFFSKVSSVGNVRGTVLDRDFHIKRIGGSTDTDYEIVALDPIGPSQSSTPGFAVWTTADPAIAGMFAAGDYCPPDKHTHKQLGEIAMEQCSDDYYDRFFDVRHPSPPFSKKKSDGDTPTNTAKPEADAPDGALDAMSERIRAMGGTAAAAPPAPENPPAADPTPAPPAQEPVPAAAAPVANSYD